VSVNGGGKPGHNTIKAINRFYKGLDADGLYSLIISMVALVPDNLTAAITPLVKVRGNDPWTNSAFGGNSPFSESDLSVNGLKNISAHKSYLATGVNPHLDLVGGDGGLTAYKFDAASSLDGTGFGVALGSKDVGDSTYMDLFLYFSNAEQVVSDMWYFTGGDRATSSATNRNGYFSSNRTSTSAFSVYWANSGNAHGSIASGGSTSNQPPNCGSISAYQLQDCNGDTGQQYLYGGTLSFLAIHHGLTSTQSSNFFNRIQTLRQALGGGFV
jgi:hypothetical protein